MDSIHQLAIHIAEHTVEEANNVKGTLKGNNSRTMRLSTDAKAAIAKLVESQLDVIALDLEAFATHARRTTITIDDIKLMVRRNPKLVSMIESKLASNGKNSKSTTTNNKTLSNPAAISDPTIIE